MKENEINDLIYAIYKKHGFLIRYINYREVTSNRVKDSYQLQFRCKCKEKNNEGKNKVVNKLISTEYCKNKYSVYIRLAEILEGRNLPDIYYEEY